MDSDTPGGVWIHVRVTLAPLLSHREKQYSKVTHLTDVTVTDSQGEEMVDSGTLETHDDPVRVTGSSGNNTKGKLVGEKRK